MQATGLRVCLSAGKLSHIVLVGGCDGNEGQRQYYSKLHQEIPQDVIVLTLGCGKFRIIGQDWGELGDTGLPRLLDMGQCNDAYSALVVATKLAEALGTDINELPLSLDISWFEQKAVAVLLTLLALGVKRVRLGPKLPAFLTAEAVALLHEKFDIRPANMENPAEDIQAMMALQ
jgi:hydroxylamine reductase